MYLEIVKVEPVQSIAKGNNVYQTVDVAYKNQDGKIQGKKLVSFQNKDVFDAITKAQSGDKFNITVEQNGKFWNWVAIAPATSAPTSVYGKPATGKVVGSNYETAAERARRQLIISRQAVLNTAIAFFEMTKQKVNLDDVLHTAAALEAWVRRPDGELRQQAEDAVRDITEDIPS
jgi:hypothetical protein